MFRFTQLQQVHFQSFNVINVIIWQTSNIMQMILYFLNFLKKISYFSQGYCSNGGHGNMDRIWCPGPGSRSPLSMIHDVAITHCLLYLEAYHISQIITDATKIKHKWLGFIFKKKSFFLLFLFSRTFKKSTLKKSCLFLFVHWDFSP